MLLKNSFWIISYVKSTIFFKVNCCHRVDCVPLWRLHCFPRQDTTMKTWRESMSQNPLTWSWKDKEMLHVYKPTLNTIVAFKVFLTWLMLNKKPWIYVATVDQVCAAYRSQQLAEEIVQTEEKVGKLAWNFMRSSGCYRKLVAQPPAHCPQWSQRPYSTRTPATAAWSCVPKMDNGIFFLCWRGAIE